METLCFNIRNTLFLYKKQSVSNIETNSTCTIEIVLYGLKGQKHCSFLLKFRKWFKYGLKAQKLLAQGIALGIIAINKAPCKGKSFVNCLILLKLLPLQGDKLASMITQGVALG